MEWTSQAVRGSTGAFARVYERHHRALYRYCRSLLGDDEEARDALQSTMTKAFAALRFEERDFELRPWLFRIAHNEAVSRLRRRREAVELDVHETVATDSLLQLVEDRERLAQLRADLRELPERQRAALVMRELNGFGHAEIAAVLGGSPQTVKQTIFAARTALHECAEGRDMRCTEVQRVLSDGDGRTLRSRRMRAHVRSCRPCREFAAALAERPRDLAVLAPAPPVALGSWLAGLLGVGGGSSAGGASWLAGGTVATKVAAVVVAAATVGGATAAVHEVAHGSAASGSPAHAASAAGAAASPSAGEGARLLAPSALVTDARGPQPGAAASSQQRRRAHADRRAAGEAVSGTDGRVKPAEKAGGQVKRAEKAGGPVKRAATAGVQVKRPSKVGGAAGRVKPAAKVGRAAGRVKRAAKVGRAAGRVKRAATAGGQAKRAAKAGGQAKRAAKPDVPGRGADPSAKARGSGNHPHPAPKGGPGGHAPPAPQPAAAVPTETTPPDPVHAHGPPTDPGASGRAHNQK